MKSYLNIFYIYNHIVIEIILSIRSTIKKKINTFEISHFEFKIKKIKNN